MIKNDKQYKITKSRLEEFNKALTQIESEEVDPLLKELHSAAIRSQIADFKDEIDEYESLKEGYTLDVYIDKISSIYELLIKARIAKRWSQADLAHRLSIKEQQIQRYEATNYCSASIERVLEIASVLDINKIDRIKVQLKEPKLDYPIGIDKEKLKVVMKDKVLFKIAN